MPKCKEPNYCCDIKGEPGCIGPQGPNGERGRAGLRGPSNENFVFGLTSTDGLGGDQRYWLIPGGQIDTSGTFLDKTIGVPPTMAIAYGQVDISRCAIHINADTIDDGTMFKCFIYSFCDDPTPILPITSFGIDAANSLCICKEIDIVKAGCSLGALAVAMIPDREIRGSINISITLYANSPLTAPT